jgi:hypothetical protein
MFESRSISLVCAAMNETAASLPCAEPLVTAIDFLNLDLDLDLDRPATKNTFMTAQQEIRRQDLDCAARAHKSRGARAQQHTPYLQLPGSDSCTSWSEKANVACKTTPE